jgi:predicted dehydrogenase
MPNRDVFRVGLLGYGLAGEFFHAPFITATEGLEIAAVVTSNPERARAASAAHPGARMVASAEELWAMADELDVVVVATPNRTHVPLARAALEAGLAVVVDKPIAATAAEGRALVAEAERRGAMLTVYQNRRWDGDILTVRRLVAEGELGEVARFESRFERWRPVAKPGWRQRPDPAEAGGLLFDLGSHLIDQALLLFGPAARVYAELDRRTPGGEVDDDVFVALTHASGVRSHLWMSSMAAQHGPRLRVLGSRAAYTKWGLDPQEAALKRGERPGRPGWGEEDPSAWGTLGADEETRPVPTETGSYTRFYEGVVRALHGDAPPPVDPHDSVAVLEIIEAARRSADEGGAVAV